MDKLLFVLLSVPLLAALVPAIIKKPNLRDAVTVAISVLLAALVVYVALRFDALQELLAMDVFFFSDTLSLSFALEPLGMLFALIVSLLWPVSTLYSMGYMRGNKKPRQGIFFAFFALAIFAALAMSFSGNMLTLLIFYEVLTFVTYPLVTHELSAEARRGGRIYLAYLVGSSLLFLLPAVMISYVQAGTLDFVPGGIVSGMSSDMAVMGLLFLYMFGVGKVAIMPMHRWLPAAMVAPTPVSALLHAVAVVKAGAFTVLKVVIYVFGLERLQSVMVDTNWLMWIAGFTIVVASLIALHQNSLKKRLAYSTVSQLSYIVLALSLFTPKAMIAAMLHMVVHAFGKITLFFTAGAIYTATKKRNIDELSAIGKAMPYTMVAFSVAALSMIAIPPTAGFVSKWMMLEAALSVESFFVAFVLVISTVLNAAYFLPIIYDAFMGKGSGKIKRKEAPVLMRIALLSTAIMTLVLFVYPNPVINLARGIFE